MIFSVAPFSTTLLVEVDSVLSKFKRADYRKKQLKTLYLWPDIGSYLENVVESPHLHFVSIKLIQENVEFKYKIRVPAILIGIKGTEQVSARTKLSAANTFILETVTISDHLNSVRKLCDT